jgi:hypothetical protein
MKKLFILTIAITASLLFVQCKKTEILTEEVIVSTEKSLTGNVLEGSNWEVLSVVSVPKNVNISFTVKHPKMNFYNDYIEMKLGRDICSKHYLFATDNITVDFASCTISNPNHQSLSDLMEGDFQYIISDNGNEMILKNNSETEITLRRVAQLGTSTPVSTSMSINTTVQ